jgi:hypothetical protein
MIKYLGTYQRDIPVEQGKWLYAREQGNDIIINYDGSGPFRIHHLSIEVNRVIRDRMPLTSYQVFEAIRDRMPFTSYQVFEVEMFAQTKEEAILLAKEFSKNILKLREDLFYVFLRHQQS